MYLVLPRKIWSGKRDSNSRPRPWQGRALPAELFPRRVLGILQYECVLSSVRLVQYEMASKSPYRNHGFSTPV